MNNSSTMPPYLVVSNPDNSLNIAARVGPPTNPFRDRYGAIRREAPGDRAIREAELFRVIAQQDFNFTYHYANPFRIPAPVIMEQSIERAQQILQMERDLQRERDLEAQPIPLITAEVESREEEARNIPLNI